MGVETEIDKRAREFPARKKPVLPSRRDERLFR
jgi:hypothetical protein